MHSRMIVSRMVGTLDPDQQISNERSGASIPFGKPDPISLPVYDYIRFVRRAGDEEIEVEFLMFGERQGRIFDRDPIGIQRWLKVLGVPWTYTLELAIDSAWNLGHVVYYPKKDRMLVMELDE